MDEYPIHDRDTSYCQSFRNIIESGRPNLNACAERWVKSVKDDCLSKLILFGETSLNRTLSRPEKETGRGIKIFDHAGTYAAFSQRSAYFGYLDT